MAAVNRESDSVGGGPRTDTDEAVAGKAVEAKALVGAGGVQAARVRTAPVAVQPERCGAFVHI